MNGRDLRIILSQVTDAGKSGDHAGALSAADEAIALAPAHADAHYLRGIALRGLKRLDEAVPALWQSLLLRPDHALAMLALAKLLVRSPDEKGRAEALALLAKAAEVPATAVKALDALGHAFRASQRRAQAVDAFSRLAALRPASADAHNNLGVALQEAAEIGAAIASFQSAVRADHAHVEARFNLGLCLLLEGDYRRGLELYEWRAALKSSALPPLPHPLWNGAPARQGDSKPVLLLRAEQGLGDTLMFLRFAPAAREKGYRVLLECQPALSALLRGAAGVDEVIARGQSLPPFDVQARLGSLPWLLGATLDTLPPPLRLNSDPLRVEHWRSVVGAKCGFTVGIAWQGSRRYTADAQRSIPLRFFGALAALPNVRLISLQKGEGGEQVDKVDFEVTVPPGLDRCAAFGDTAALMGAVDLVVTSDTSIAHLAGAMGVRAWVALPRVADWRWGMSGEGSAWYPGLRLFRQTRAGDWGEVFERMANEIEKLAGPKRVDVVNIGVSPGELIDRLTILSIKASRISEPVKLARVRRELEEMSALAGRCLPENPELERLRAALMQANETLWEIEDRLRESERAGRFNEQFTSLARAVYHANDRRSELKGQVNVLLGSHHGEEKSYAKAGRTRA